MTLKRDCEYYNGLLQIICNLKKIFAFIFYSWYFLCEQLFHVSSVIQCHKSMWVFFLKKLLCASCTWAEGLPRANVYEVKLLQDDLPWFRGELMINLFSWPVHQIFVH